MVELKNRYRREEFEPPRRQERQAKKLSASPSAFSRPLRFAPHPPKAQETQIFPWRSWRLGGAKPLHSGFLPPTLLHVITLHSPATPPAHHPRIPRRQEMKRLRQKMKCLWQTLNCLRQTMKRPWQKVTRLRQLATGFSFPVTGSSFFTTGASFSTTGPSFSATNASFPGGGASSGGERAAISTAPTHPPVVPRSTPPNARHTSDTTYSVDWLC
jgi:hypothetical protein